jgi:Ricin-type beta-trefoil lectin domain-like
MYSNKMLQRLVVAAISPAILCSRSAEAQEAQAARVQLVLIRLYCVNTTERGHDEVYYILGGLDGNELRTNKRGPSANEGADADDRTAWDMNDRGDKQDRAVNAILYEGPLAIGQAATLNLAFRESDGTDFGTTLRDASQIAQGTSDDPTVQFIASMFDFLGRLIPRNEDDALGSFQLKARNENGILAVETSPGQYTTVHEAFDGASGTFAYYFDHDDGKYVAYFRVRLFTVGSPQPNTWYHLQCQISSLFLDVKDYRIGDNADICQALKDGKQAWRLVPSEKHPGYYQIEFKTGSSFRYLDVYRRNLDDGGRVCLAAFDPDQVWRLIPEADGYYRIQAFISNYYLDDYLAALHVGARICQARGANGGQVWRFVPAD